MKKLIFIVLPAIAIALLMGYIFIDSQKVESPVVGEPRAADYKDVELIIEGQSIKLQDGYAEVETAPGSASKTVIRYFGNELKTDLNSDGREDVAFIVTAETGGSGVFYYAVAAIAVDDGYRGTDGYFLGDRILPQSTDMSQNPRHEQVVVFNYMDRLEGEPMTTVPATGKSTYLKLDDESMRWAIVEPNFEGEATYTERYSARVDRVNVTFEHKDYTTYRLTTNDLVREGELNTERGFGDDADATVYVLNWQQPEGERIYYVRLTGDPIHVYVLDGNRKIIEGSALTLEQ